MCSASSFTSFESLIKYQLLSETWLLYLILQTTPHPALFFLHHLELTDCNFVSHRIAAHLYKWSKWELSSSMWSSPQETRHLVQWICHCPKLLGDNFFKSYLQRELKAFQGKQSCVLKAVFLKVCSINHLYQNHLGWGWELIKKAVSWALPHICWIRISRGWGWGTCLLNKLHRWFLGH